MILLNYISTDIEITTIGTCYGFEDLNLLVNCNPYEIPLVALLFINKSMYVARFEILILTIKMLPFLIVFVSIVIIRLFTYADSDYTHVT